MSGNPPSTRVTADDRLRARLAELKGKGRGTVFCVMGAGNGGLAMAGHLGVLGHRVRLYNRTEENLQGVLWHGGVRVEGAVTGFGPVEVATSDVGEALDGADVIMIVTPSTAHRELAAACAPVLDEGQLVVLNPGRTGGALEFRKVLGDAGGTTRALVG